MARNCALFERYERAKFLGAADNYRESEFSFGGQTVRLVYENVKDGERMNRSRYFSIPHQRNPKFYCWTLAPDTNGKFWSFVVPVKRHQDRKGVTVTIEWSKAVQIRAHRSNVKAKRRAKKLCDSAARRLVINKLRRRKVVN